MSMISYKVGSYPSNLLGTITFASGSGNFTPGETITGTGFSAHVTKWVASTKKLTVKRISGNPTATSTLTGGSSGATGVVATITSGTVGHISVYTGGWNLRETDNGIVRSKTVGSRIKVEVMVAERELYTLRSDLSTVATFTLTGGAWSAGTTYSVASGSTITFTIVASKPVIVPQGTTYGFTVQTSAGATVTTPAALYLSSTSDNLTHTFAYTVQAADEVTGGKLAITTGNLTLPAGHVVEQIAGAGVLAMVESNVAVPTAVGGALATKTGVSITA